ncbi:MAG: DUF4126 domain-containing protein [Chthoniobacter sp.]|uniref:DUF4126 domain-containing protein n=1 Tax=Chthoniobacter sp. TaxID=2510640 RepID=UPI0032A3B683
MQVLQTLGVALGLASLAGLNLYLTVFVTGLAIQQQWVDVSQSYPELAVLAHPAVLILSGVLYLLQFFADKVPWVDSLWDAVHTFIRPIGGAFLVVHVLDKPDPTIEVIAALLAGGVALTTHSVKAGTRLVANHSPEPFSNIALSLGEDALVVGGLFLIKQDPFLALIVFSVLLLAIGYLGPIIFRGARVQLWLIWKKIASPAADKLETKLSRDLPHELDVAFFSVNLERDPIAWAAPCISTSARRLPGNVFGFLVATERPGPKLAFVAKRGWKQIAVELDLTGYQVAHEPKFLSENVVLHHLEKKPRYIFLFARGQRAIVKAVVASITGRLAASLPAPEEPARIEEPAISS